MTIVAWPTAECRPNKLGRAYGRRRLERRREPTDYLFHSADYNMGVTAFQTIHPWEAGDISAESISCTGEAARGTRPRPTRHAR